MSIEMRSILIAFISAVGLYWYVDGNIAAALGRAAGALVIPFTVAYFASKGRIRNTTNVAFSIAAVVVIAVASIPFYKTYQLKETANTSADKISGLVDAQEKMILSNSDTEASSTRDPGSREVGTVRDPRSRMIELFTEYKEREFALTKVFQESAEVAKLPPILSNPFSFSTLSGLRQLRSALADYERRYSLYSREFTALKNEAAGKMRSTLSTPQALQAFDRGFNSSRFRYERLIAIDVEIVSLYRNTADLLEPLAAFGQVSVTSEGQVLIESDAVLDRFNQNVVQIQKLGLEREQLAKEFISSQRALVEQLRGM